MILYKRIMSVLKLSTIQRSRGTSNNSVGEQNSNYLVRKT